MGLEDGHFDGRTIESFGIRLGFRVFRVSDAFRVCSG